VGDRRERRRDEERAERDEEAGEGPADGDGRAETLGVHGCSFNTRYGRSSGAPLVRVWEAERDPVSDWYDEDTDPPELLNAWPAELKAMVVPVTWFVAPRQAIPPRCSRRRRFTDHYSRPVDALGRRVRWSDLAVADRL
jgi:hypothetical protein